MIALIFIYTVLVFQGKEPPKDPATALIEKLTTPLPEVPVDPNATLEYKFVRIARNENYRLLMAAYRAENECLKDAAAYRAKACDKYDSLIPELRGKWELSKAQVEAVDGCTKLYRRTIDKKQSNLTVRESTSVKACQALDLYPLEMPAQAK